jgi:hypothetical protein
MYYFYMPQQRIIPGGFIVALQAVEFFQTFPLLVLSAKVLVTFNLALKIEPETIEFALYANCCVLIIHVHM